MGMEIEFFGVRGTRPVTGREFERFGGDTACVVVKLISSAEPGAPATGVGAGADTAAGSAAAGVSAAGTAAGSGSAAGTAAGSGPATGANSTAEAGPGPGGNPEEKTSYFVIDAGTGIVAAGRRIAGTKAPVTIFLSHLHHDHLAGLPFFAPFFEPGRPVQVMAPAGTRDKLLAYFAPPYFPLTVDDLPAQVTLIELAANASVTNRVGRGNGSRAVVHSLRLPGELHPKDGVTWFAVEFEGKRVLYASDFEWARASEPYKERMQHFARGADVLILDAQYRESEYPAFEGYGHNTVRTAMQFGQSVDAGKIVLFHHDPHRDDEAVAGMEAAARAAADIPGDRIVAARVGMRIEL